MSRSPLHLPILIALVASAVAVLVLGTQLDPDPRGHGTHEQLGLPACGIRERWNVPCPTCGVTTSVALLVHGEPRAAVANQPFGFLLAIGLPLLALWAIWMHVRKKDLGAVLLGPIGSRAIAICLLLLLASWGWRLIHSSSLGGASSSSAVSGSTSSSISR
ncbi:MAG: DUF2752 domain-containing protein [bacterium]|nr:DUF2752 domain-containing protein [bacterium]